MPDAREIRLEAALVILDPSVKRMVGRILW